VCIAGGNYTLSESGERSGPKRVCVPKGKARRKGERERERGRVSERPGAREGNRNGHNKSLEAMTRERKERKEGLYCMSSTLLFARAR